MDKVEAAILAADAKAGSLKEKWIPVVTLLEPVHVATLDPILRLIKGHACLAVNENNESLCLFLSITSKDEARQWQTWAQRFAARAGDKAIVWYYCADAAARLGQWDEAVSLFGKSLGLQAQHPLALNGRGVAYANQNKSGAARVAFAKAARCSASSLADANANIGALRIQTKEGADGALLAFKAALGASPQFALALHGRGCVELIKAVDVKGTEQAKRDLAEALRLAGCDLPAQLMFANQVRYVAAASGVDPDTLLADAREAGTSLKRSYQDRLESSITGNLKAAETARGMTGLPYNKYVANFFGNRAVERTEQMHAKFGDAGVDRLFSNHPAQKAPLLGEVARVGGFNGPDLQRSQIRDRNIGLTVGAIGTAGAAASAAGTVTAPAAPFFAAAGAAGGVKAAEKTIENSWSQAHSTFAQTMIGRYGSQSSNPTFDHLKQSGPGGLAAAAMTPGGLGGGGLGGGKPGGGFQGGTGDAAVLGRLAAAGVIAPPTFAKREGDTTAAGPGGVTKLGDLPGAKFGPAFDHRGPLPGSTSVPGPRIFPWGAPGGGMLVPGVSSGGGVSQGDDKPAGGVQISLADIKWDDGKWPFKPYYGLAYGLVQLQDRSAASQHPERVPTHAKPKSK